ncbi:MAG: transglycosylase SLT domain-containing protein [Parvularculaceae bacterium]|nr:transglycosylase SLT domain-containing protein [Parvularculaceae bacterium]
MTVEATSAVKNDDSSASYVKKAIRQAARQTGLDFDLMLGVAKRESSLQADAKAKTSSASGLFQFIDQTWLGAVKEHGQSLGLGNFAKDIQQSGKGFTVTDPARKDEILNLRFNPVIAAKVAGKTLAGAKDRLTQALGREASPSEVYMSHFLGERGATRMLAAGDQAVAAEIDPRAANANQTLFFQNGRALSVAEFRDKIALHIGTGEPQAAAPPGPVVAAAPVTPELPLLGPYRPTAVSQPARVETYSPPSAPSYRSTINSLPPQLHAAIVEMQANFIFGRDDN